MRKIKVPEPITLLNVITDEVLLDEKRQPRVVTFREFGMQILADSSWVSSIENIESGVKIAKLLKFYSQGSMEIEDGDFERFKKALEKPASGQVGGYHPQVMFQLMPHVNAIRNAEIVEHAKARD